MKNETYKGFTILKETNPRHLDMIVAERFGVTLRANDINLLKRMIDNHIEDNNRWFNERKSS